MKKKSEVDYARVLTTWLKAEGWDVYEEVSLSHADAADIIAVRKPVVAAIEVKTSLSLTVLGQAHRWIKKAHLTYVAVPRHKRDTSAEGAAWVCKTLGIGLFYINKNSVTEVVHPVFRRVDVKPLMARLRPEQQDGSIPAGSVAGLRYTPWRMTVIELVRRVSSNPGITMKEALDGMKHHYGGDKAARASLSRQIREGMIKELRFDGTSLHLNHRPEPPTGPLPR